MTETNAHPKVREILSSAAVRGTGPMVVYTAVFGGCDNIRKIPENFEGCPCYCFTDEIARVPQGWVAIRIADIHRDPRRTAKIFKLFPALLFPDSRTSIWIDGSIAMKNGMRDLLKTGEAEGFGLRCFPHPQRDCAYSEALACALQGKDSAWRLARQMLGYRLRGYPRKAGLIAGGVLMREHGNAAVMKTMDLWWSEIEAGSVRDQLSFNYSAWRTGLAISYFGNSLLENPWMEWITRPRQKLYGPGGREAFSLPASAFGMALGMKKMIRKMMKKRLGR